MDSEVQGISDMCEAFDVVVPLDRVDTDCEGE